MDEEIEVLVELLTDVLGKPRTHYESKFQLTFDCPVCAKEKGFERVDGKSNFEVNYKKHVYHCWACGETNGTSGPLGKLFDRFGTKKQKKIYLLIRPEELKKEESKKIQLKLPEGYTTFEDSNPRYPPRNQALNYLYSRGITDDIIKKYKIGFTVTGSYEYRIIVPSYDIDGTLNYFIARSWIPKKMKYKNPSVPKDEIIFNERLISWDKDVYLVEGVFDAFFLDNSIAMLGKALSKLLFETLYIKANGNIIICTDGDAVKNGLAIYQELNGGRLYNKIKFVKLPEDKDICDLRGQISEYYHEIK